MTRKSALEKQCELISWSFSSVTAVYSESGSWSFNGSYGLRPEEVVAQTMSNHDCICSWCEGGSINLMLKAASLSVLIRRNTFQDRSDAIRRYLEAQLTILSQYSDEIVECARSITHADLIRNIKEICADDFLRDAYPRVREEFLFKLADKISVDLRIQLLEKYMLKPYEYRAGWPDLTVISSEGISFVEVKTTDRLHDSQMRFANEIAAPLQLRCEIVRVIPAK